MGYADLHAHFLAALDDGSPDLATTTAMLRALQAVGYDTLTATPHQKVSQFMPSSDEIDTALRAASQAAPPGLSLRLAAENYWDDVFFERSQFDTIPCYDGTRAFLFEIPPEEVPVRFEDTLFHLGMKGLLPVMAHPERYRPFWADVDRLAHIGASVPLVVDLGAVAGYHGARETKVARHLLAEGIAAAAATDVHTLADVRTAAEGIAWIKKKLGPEAERRLLDENPRRILQGHTPE